MINTMKLKNILAILLLSVFSNSFMIANSFATPPNFVVILADDLGYADIIAYRDCYEGDDDKSLVWEHTPHLDKMARGRLCTHALCRLMVCSQ